MNVRTGLVSDDMLCTVNHLELKCLGEDPRRPEDGHMSGRNILVTTVQ